MARIVSDARGDVSTMDQCLDAQIDSLRAVDFGLRLADCFGVDPWYLAFGEGSSLSDSVCRYQPSS